MKIIRVFVTKLPRILRDMVTRLIDEQEDMQTVGRDSAGNSSHDRLEEIKPDVLLMACGPAQASEKAKEFLSKIPTARVISITSEGGRGTIYELRPYEIPLGEISPKSLIDTIREVGQC